MGKEAFTRKISLLTRKINFELGKTLVRCYLWSIALTDSETWTLRKLVQRYSESFAM
jgi:hypothetical protein